MKPSWRGIIAALTGLLAAIPVAAAEQPVLLVEQPVVLSALEERGYGFGSLFGLVGPDDLATLHRDSPAFRVIVETISRDVLDLKAEMKEGGRPLAEFTAAETGRVMDMRWLSTSAAHLRLAGVVNRIDRSDFHAASGEGTCGEVRLIYRLAYSFRKGAKGKVLSSRMPLSFNAVFDLPRPTDGSCSAVIAGWRPQQRAGADWLASGPLKRSSLRFRQLELNAQVVRFPSGQEPAFGGQAVYLMRIFGIDGDQVSELPMENTPDTAELSGDAELRARLAAYVSANVGAIDTGVYQVPSEFLATKVVSYSTFGNARSVNHPFSQLFVPDDLVEEFDLSSTRLKTLAALMQRLDNGTCQGCHQAGGTAGFHMIGLDDAFTSPLNRIEVGVSPHLAAELPRRQAWLAAVEARREPDRFRPLSFAPPAEWNADGSIVYKEAEASMPCLTPDASAALGSGWACTSGTVCTPLAQTEGAGFEVAQCLLPTQSEQMYSGHPCLEGVVTSSMSQPFKDDYQLTQFTAFAAKASPRDYTCRPPRIGVPGGMAYRQCDEKDRAFTAFRSGKPMPREICGLTGGKKFDLCVSTGRFDECLAGAVQRGNRAACSAEHLCRDDYICQAFPPDVPNVSKVKGVGFCSPTYFMFQMRIDNHTTPWATRQRSVYRSVEAEPGESEDDLW